MKHALRAMLAAMALVAAAGWAHALKMEQGMNNAMVVDYPTALDQPTRHMFRGTLDIFDISEPDLRPLNLGHGYQIGNLQILTDLYFLSQPKEFDRGEFKLKLRFLGMDEFGVHAALGALTRIVDKRSKEKTVIDERPYSLFLVGTYEFFPFKSLGQFLGNFYLDNRFGVLGAKAPLYSSMIKVVVESEYHHAALTEDRWHHKGGLELEGEQNFYVQFLFSSIGERWRLQVGTGF